MKIGLLCPDSENRQQLIFQSISPKENTHLSSEKGEGGEGAIHNIAEVRLVTRLSYPEGASGVYKPTKLPTLHEKLGWLNW